MGNIIDYVKNYGNIPLTLENLNEIDALVFAYITSIKWSGIIPSPEEKEYITVEDAYSLLGEKLTTEEMPMCGVISDNKHFLYDAMAKSVRFKDLRLLNYVCINSKEEFTQFEAVTIEINKKQAVVSFAGTDGTLASWKENFTMVFKDSVPAQVSAVNYINQISRYYKKICLTGHSKGGNLAIFGATNCKPRVQKKIEKIFNYDCPGFKKDFFEKPEYKKIRDRIFSFYPCVSFVGMIMNRDEKYKVVDTTDDSIRAHKAFYWIVEEDKFKILDSLAVKGEYHDIVTDEFLNDIPDETREEFVLSFFGVLEDAGVETTKDLKHLKRDTMSAILKNFMALSRQQKKLIIKVFFKLLGAGGKYSYMIIDPEEEYFTGSSLDVKKIAEKIKDKFSRKGHEDEQESYV